jgi:hypothetical protein
MPNQGILIGASCYSQTSQTLATMSVHLAGDSATQSVIAAAGQFTSTNARTLVISPTNVSIAAGTTVEVRINVANTGNTMIFLYFA